VSKLVEIDGYISLCPLEDYYSK